jgi:hypothetical protein
MIRDRPSNDEERARLQAAAPRLGGLLGWQTGDVVAFAGAPTHRRWDRCGSAELGAVLEEYLALARAVHARACRRAHRHAEART